MSRVLDSARSFDKHDMKTEMTGLAETLLLGVRRGGSAGVGGSKGNLGRLLLQSEAPGDHKNLPSHRQAPRSCLKVSHNAFMKNFGCILVVLLRPGTPGGCKHGQTLVGSSKSRHRNFRIFVICLSLKTSRDPFGRSFGVRWQLWLLPGQLFASK